MPTRPKLTTVDKAARRQSLQKAKLGAKRKLDLNVVPEEQIEAGEEVVPGKDAGSEDVDAGVDVDEPQKFEYWKRVMDDKLVCTVRIWCFSSDQLMNALLLFTSGTGSLQNSTGRGQS
jgi:hypothetical protein